MRRLIELVFLAIFAYLILSNALQFSISVRALGRTATDAIKVLQGR